MSGWLKSGSRWGAMVVGVGVGLSAGCGVDFGQARADRYREDGSGGKSLVRDEIAVIVDDPSLSDEEKRRLLRENGLRDEDLIDALIRGS